MKLRSSLSFICVFRLLVFSFTIGSFAHAMMREEEDKENIAYVGPQKDAEPGPDDEDSASDLSEEEETLDNFFADLRAVHSAVAIFAHEARLLAKVRVILEDLTAKSTPRLDAIQKIDPDLASKLAPQHYAALADFVSFHERATARLLKLFETATRLEEEAFGKPGYVGRFLALESRISDCTRAWSDAGYLTDTLTLIATCYTHRDVAQGFFVSRARAHEQGRQLELRLDAMRQTLVDLVLSRRFTPIGRLTRESSSLCEEAEGFIAQLESLKESGSDLESIVFNAKTKFRELKARTDSL